jgi:hypothetical protein
MKTPTQLHFAVAALTLLAATSCSKVPITSLPLPPSPILKSLQQFPMERYLDSSFALSSDTIFLTLSAAGIDDPTIQHAEVPGQAEFAISFRTSVAAALTSLALDLPDSGFTHTVTLWDSTTGAVLAQSDITTRISGKWSSVNLALLGQAVQLVPGNGYILGLNSLAVGNAEDAPGPGNEIFVLYGIYDFSQGPAKSSLRNIMPIVEGPITFESTWIVYFDPPATAPAFPGTQPTSGDPHTVSGLVDFGYIPTP